MRSSVLVRQGLAAFAALVVSAIVVPDAAHADYEREIDVATSMVSGTLDRARRAIAIGPHVGGFGGLAVSPNDGIGGISFGLALYTFQIPTVLDMREILEQRIKARVKERVEAMIASGAMAPTDLTEIVREVAADVKAELFGERTGRTLEKPNLGIILEGVRLISPEGWQGRLGLSKGVGPVSLGLAGGFQRAGGATRPLIGLEVSLRLTPVGRAFTPVFEIYTRFDLDFGDGERGSAWVVGLRALLDLI